MLFSDDIKHWPTVSPNSQMPVVAIQLDGTVGLTITSSGTGTFDGNGAAWWGLPGVGYLMRGKNRPPLLEMNGATDLTMEHLLFYQAPRFNVNAGGLRNATIRYCEVSARRTADDGHGVVDPTAFNTDGFDVSGQVRTYHTDTDTHTHTDTHTQTHTDTHTHTHTLRNVHV